MSARPASPEALLKALGATTFAGSATVLLDAGGARASVAPPPRPAAADSLAACSALLSGALLAEAPRDARGHEDTAALSRTAARALRDDPQAFGGAPAVVVVSAERLTERRRAVLESLGLPAGRAWCGHRRGHGLGDGLGLDPVAAWKAADRQCAEAQWLDEQMERSLRECRIGQNFLPDGRGSDALEVLSYGAVTGIAMPRGGWRPRDMEDWEVSEATMERARQGEALCRLWSALFDRLCLAAGGLNWARAQRDPDGPVWRCLDGIAMPVLVRAAMEGVPPEELLADL